MQIYNFSPQTGEFVSATLARPDPMRPGKYLIPANATTEAPPDVTSGRVALWTGSEWKVVEDHRGVEYWLAEDDWTTAARIMTDLGPLPDGATTTKPEQTETDATAEVDTECSRLVEATDKAVLQVGADIRIAERNNEDTTALEAKLASLDDYRVELLAVSDQAGYPWSITWPVMPE